MGNKTNAASNRLSTSDATPSAPKKPKRASAKESGKTKSTLKEKAVKAVAAVAAGVGGAIAAKRASSAKRKAPAPVPAPVPVQVLASEPDPAATYPTREEIALRAYFLAESRKSAGQPADPQEDWLEAERQLAQESAVRSH